MTVVALLRAIAHVPMEPFRRAMEEMGYQRVESFGMSGNLIFDAAGEEPRGIERRVAGRFGTDAFVRTRAEMTRVAAAHPFGEEAGGAVMFLARAPAAGRRRALSELQFDGPPPLLRGRAVHFVHPLAVRGLRGPVDFERLLGVRGTARSLGVVRRVLEKMGGA